MLVLNVGGVVDISPVIDEVSNVLLLSQTGMTVGDSFADVLLGKNYPSGKLASTWAKYEEYCHVGDFAEIDDTRYKEGIYVGYRYFDTVGKKPMFPFGYGISFTTFDIASKNLFIDKTQIKVPVKIKNTGGTILPETGGIGTGIYLISGSLLLLAPIVYLIVKRSKVNRKSAVR